MDVKGEIIKILEQQNKPMKCEEIYKEIVKRGKLKLMTSTPLRSICTIIVLDMKKGDKSNFIRTSRGYYNLKTNQN